MITSISPIQNRTSDSWEVCSFGRCKGGSQRRSDVNFSWPGFHGTGGIGHGLPIQS